jgi:peptidoglycan/xylan/chitin deacetylase (PgdA/CDA1 family)
VTDKSTETQEEYDQRIESDLLRSRQDIKAKIGTDPDILCWPFGAYNNHTNTLAQQAGFVYMIGPTGYNTPSTDVENINRVAVPGGMDMNEFTKLVNPRKVNYFQAMGLELERIKLRLMSLSKHC